MFHRSQLHQIILETFPSMISKTVSPVLFPHCLLFLPSYHVSLPNCHYVRDWNRVHESVFLSDNRVNIHDAVDTGLPNGLSCVPADWAGDSDNVLLLFICFAFSSSSDLKLVYKLLKLKRFYRSPVQSAGTQLHLTFSGGLCKGIFMKYDLHFWNSHSIALKSTNINPVNPGFISFLTPQSWPTFWPARQTKP